MMSLRIFTILIAAAGLLLEAYLMEQIFNHPAAGPEQVSLSTKLVFIGFASLPYFALLVLSFYGGRLNNKESHWVRYSLITLAVGVAFTYIGLRQFGHSTLAILLIGYVAQWVAIGSGAFRNPK